MFNIGDNEAPGPDGYTSACFKASWHEVITAIKEFFGKGKLLKEWNNIIISLIPKVPTSSRITDY